MQLSPAVTVGKIAADLARKLKLSSWEGFSLLMCLKDGSEVKLSPENFLMDELSASHPSSVGAVLRFAKVCVRGAGKVEGRSFFFSKTTKLTT